MVERPPKEASTKKGTQFIQNLIHFLLPEAQTYEICSFGGIFTICYKVRISLPLISMFSNLI